MDGKMDLAGSVGMLRHVSHRLIEQADILTDADLAIGDGDHGIGMQRGFEGVLESFDETPPQSPEEAFKAAGTAILSKTGGAAGAIFGTLFRAGSKAFVEREVLSGHDFAAFLDSGLQAVLKRGGVTEGQKTIIDALAPAARAALACSGDDWCDVVLKAASQAADAGVEATKAMIATTGKARSLGERSIGHPDPGAISVSLILKAMEEYAAKA